MTVKVSMSKSVLRSLPLLPEASERVWLPALHSNGTRLLSSRVNLLPLIERISRHKATEILERLTKGRRFGDGLGHGVNAAQTNPSVLRPVGHESPRIRTISRSPMSRFNLTMGWKVCGAKCSGIFCLSDFRTCGHTWSSPMKSVRRRLADNPLALWKQRNQED